MTDKELISRAISMWANYIETGTVTLSAADANQRNEFSGPRDKIKINALTADQVELVERIKKLSINVLREESSVSIVQPRRLDSPCM